MNKVNTTYLHVQKVYILIWSVDVVHADLNVMRYFFSTINVDLEQNQIKKRKNEKL